MDTPDNIRGAQGVQFLPAELLWQAIVDSSDDGILGKTLEGIITSWNAGAQRLFGYSAEEVIGRSTAMLVPPDRVEAESTFVARLRRGDCWGNE